MKEMNLSAIFPKANKNKWKKDKYNQYPYLLKDLAIEKTNQVWATDITYIRLHDGKGRCFDNIINERLWRTVKYEEVYLKSYKSVNEARRQLMDFVEFYNYQRPHQSLKYKTPAEIYFANKIVN